MMKAGICLHYRDPGRDRSQWGLLWQPSHGHYPGYYNEYAYRHVKLTPGYRRRLATDDSRDGRSTHHEPLYHLCWSSQSQARRSTVPPGAELTRRCQGKSGQKTQTAGNHRVHFCVPMRVHHQRRISWLHLLLTFYHGSKRRGKKTREVSPSPPSSKWARKGAGNTHTH